ncbi:hypothetical protein G6F58_013545 [Rhizopus delemar]|nr:hypothetical protein G6F58_013545 [Rhizopus delemar]
MRMICVVTPTGMPNRWFNPLFICATPRPSEVATPSTVPMMAKISTAWPMGPWMRLPISGRMSSGMAPSCSMVRYEMQRRASSRCGPMMAWVGQTSMQRVQVPQWAVAGVSIGSGISM